jgi:hypothetical protein
MTKSMSRIVVVVVALASMLAVFSAADAQTDYAPTDPVPSRGSTFHPDPATALNGFLGFGNSINPVASTTTDGTSTGGGLAVTGSETDLGLAIGIGLLAVGGTAFVASRKRDDE